MAYRMVEVTNVVVTNCIVAADPSDFPQLIDVTGILIDGKQPSIGWTYNGSVFAPPPAQVDPTPLPYKRYSLSEFISVLTDDELGVLLELVNQLPGSVTLQSGAASSANHHRKAKRVWAKWAAANEVDFNDTFTYDAITWLVVNTTEWTPARGSAIANGP